MSVQSVESIVHLIHRASGPLQAERAARKGSQGSRHRLATTRFMPVHPDRTEAPPIPELRRDVEELSGDREVPADWEGVARMRSAVDLGLSTRPKDEPSKRGLFVRDPIGMNEPTDRRDLWKGWKARSLQRLVTPQGSGNLAATTN